MGPTRMQTRAATTALALATAIAPALARANDAPICVDVTMDWESSRLRCVPAASTRAEPARPSASPGPKRGRRDGEYVALSVRPIFLADRATTAGRASDEHASALGLDFAYGEAVARDQAIALDVGAVVANAPMFRVGAVYDAFPTASGVHLQAGLAAAVLIRGAYGGMDAPTSDTGTYGALGRLGVGYAFGGPGTLAFDVRARLDGGAFVARGAHAFVGAASVELGLLSF